MPKKKPNEHVIRRVFIILSLVASLSLYVGAGLAWWGYSFATSMVRDELKSQKIFFPPKGSPALDPAEFPDLQVYAGQQVDTGPEAKAFANGFIGRHLEKIAGGKTYSEVSAESMKDPSNAKLAQQKQLLFQGETLRGMLLGEGYAFWTFGTIAKYAAAVAAVLATASGAVGLVLWHKRP